MKSSVMAIVRPIKLLGMLALLLATLGTMTPEPASASAGEQTIDVNPIGCRYRRGGYLQGGDDAR